MDPVAHQALQTTEQIQKKKEQKKVWSFLITLSLNSYCNLRYFSIED
jgi:cytochrome c oxidase subunit IV